MTFKNAGLQISFILLFKKSLTILPIPYTRYTLINFHLAFTDTCEPFQTHFLIRVKASEVISEGLALPLDFQSQMAGRAGVG